MILQELKNMYQKASEKVLKAAINDLKSAVAKHEHRGTRGLDREARDGAHH